MKIPKFLEPERRKFVLPVLLIIFLFVSFAGFYLTGNIIDKYSCNRKFEINSNNTNGLTATGNNTQIDSNNSYTQINVQITKMRPFFQISEALYSIDPLIPLPCTVYHGIAVCSYYISEDSYDCLKNILEQNRENFTSENNVLALPYEQNNLSNPLFLLFVLGSALLLLAEGYILSSIALFLYRRHKTKKI